MSLLLEQEPALERAYLVGGCVRDWLLAQPIKDIDLEVFGVEPGELEIILRRHGRVDLVGQSFGVFKLTLPGEQVIDFSLPRRDSKTAAGHRGFEIRFDPDLTLAESASRRDFTINSLLYHPRTSELHDFFGGQKDLDRRLLRHTSDAFSEDPLRVLRGMQFAGRFELTPVAETLEKCREMKRGYSELPVERVREEWWKWASLSRRPSAGLQFLVASEWVEHFPELQALAGTPQDPLWHPEGDVFVHTAHCCDAMAQLPLWQTSSVEKRVTWMLAILCHDFGKPSTTHRAIKQGEERIVSPGHEKAGVVEASKFLDRLKIPERLREEILPLIENHLAHIQPLTERAVRRLSRRLAPATIPELCLIITADHQGRPPKPSEVPKVVGQLEAMAQQLAVTRGPPERILKGRHLLELGWKPGPEMGRILEEVYEAQLSGAFAELEGALAWLRSNTEPPGK